MEEKRVCKVEQLDNNDILPNRFQPRKYFDEEEILQLAESIKEHGVINPIIVRKLGDKYELVAGERRYKANILAGNDNIPAIIMDVNDKESSEIAVVENIQRKDLNPVEEAISYKRSLDIGYMTQEQLAHKMGKSQSYIANKIRLLKLSDEVQDALMKKEISERHARSLLKLTSQKKQNELLKRIIDERLTVRKTDEEIEKMNNDINNSIGGTYNMNNDIMGNNVVSPTLNVNNNILNNNMFYDQQVQNEQLGNNELIEPQIESIKEEITPIVPEIPISDVNLESFNIENSPSIPELNQNQTSINNDFIVPKTEPIEEEITPIVPEIPISDVSLESFNIENSPSVPELNQDQTSINNDFVLPRTEPIEEEITSISKEQMLSSPNLDSFDFKPLSPQPELDNIKIVENNDFMAPKFNPIEENVLVETEPTVSELGMNTINIPSVESDPDTLSIDNSAVLNSIDESIANNSLVSNLYMENNQQNIQNSPTNMFNSGFNVDSRKDEPIFKSSPIIDTTLSQNLKNDIQSTSNIDVNIDNKIEKFDDTNNFYRPEVKPEPIIVNEYNQQYDPIMPDNHNNKPTIDFKTILSLIRKCSAAIENSGYKIETEEYNLDNLYQVVFKIEKK